MESVESVSTCRGTRHGPGHRLKRQGTLYYNENAGSYDPDTFPLIESTARDAGLDVVAIEPGLDIRDDIRKRLDRGHELFIIGGGDGSIHHAIQALARTDGVLAILPIGTFNHLAKDLGVPLDPMEALELALHGETQSIDLGTVNGRYFANNMLLGIYPEIVRRRESLRRAYSKWRAYWKAVRFALKRFPHVAVQLETDHSLDVVKTHMLAIVVNEYDMDSAGILAPKASFDSGVLTVYWIPFRAKWSYFSTLIRYLRGKLIPGDDMRRISTRTLKVRARRKRLKVGIDGELLIFEGPFDVMIVPAGLRVRAPLRSRNHD